MALSAGQYRATAAFHLAESTRLCNCGDNCRRTEITKSRTTTVQVSSILVRARPGNSDSISVGCENDVVDDRIDLMLPALAAEHTVVADPSLHVMTLAIGTQALA